MLSSFRHPFFLLPLLSHYFLLVTASPVSSPVNITTAIPADFTTLKCPPCPPCPACPASSSSIHPSIPVTLSAIISPTIAFLAAWWRKERKERIEMEDELDQLQRQQSRGGPEDTREDSSCARASAEGDGHALEVQDEK